MEPVRRESTIHLTSPRAAAVAGIVFSALFIVSLVLIRLVVPPDPQDAGAWIVRDSEALNVALYLLPFAGIAFLWFIGVLRDCMGRYEDRFFATVFLGSGLLFLASLFVAGAVSAGVLYAYTNAPGGHMETGLYSFGRVIVDKIMNVYALKMAAVFMVSTSTVAIRTRIFPRWMAWLGYTLALLLLLSLGYLYWVPLIFPLWVLLISGYILIANLKKR